jgi:hypothetical protein
MLAELAFRLGPWNWLIVGLVLLALELLTPGMFLVWLGLAAFLVGLIGFVVDWSWQSQILAFALFSAAAVPIWRRMARGGKRDEGADFLNQRALALVGRVFTLEKPIADGHGAIRVDDTVWRVSGPDCSAGSRVKVVRADGVSLIVEKD